MYQTRGASARGEYNLFLSFLLFRGYYQPSMLLVKSHQLRPTSLFISAHANVREKLRAAHKALGYVQVFSRNKKVDDVGPELELLIWLLAFAHKPLQELTRDDFDTFWQAYHEWYREKRKNHHPNNRLFRLEHMLIHLGIIPSGKVIKTHEDYLAPLRSSSVRSALAYYLQWCSAKYKQRTVSVSRLLLVIFFEWLEVHDPSCDSLQAVTRKVAVAYAEHLRGQCEQGHISPTYRNQHYHAVRAFFNFVIDEEVEPALRRNPFATSDLPARPDMIPRYLSDHELRTILTYCEKEASLLERTVTMVLLHTGIRAAELAALKHSDIVQIGGTWKVHIHQGKGLKDRIIPLTEQCKATLQAWQESKRGREPSEYIFTYHNHPWSSASNRVCGIIREMGHKIGLEGVTPHRFRHTFAVALINYGVRESALQKLMGHTTLSMTLEYARILDETVERSFTEAIEQMREGAMSWVPNFFVQEDYTLFAEGDSVSWIQLPVGFCRRNPKLHCESDVKCFLCERFCATPKDLPRLQQMYERFMSLGLKLKADVVAAQIRQVQFPSGNRTSRFIPTNAIPLAPKRRDSREAT